MKLLISTPIRFQSTPDGAVWARQEADGYTFWTRYLAGFDELTLLARVRPVSTPSANWLRADGPGVRFAPVPDFVGPYQLMRRWFPVRAAVRTAVGNAEAVLMRVPCNIGAMTWRYLPAGHPYAVEVLGDPYASLSPAAMDTSMRALWRWLLPHYLRKICQGASGAAYVTQFALQRLYPPNSLTFSTSYSDVMTTHYTSARLKQCVIRTEARQYAANQKAFTIICVGAMEMLPKAQDVLIKACALCVRGGMELRLVLVGDGKMRAKLESLTAQTGMSGRVTFAGQLRGEDQITRALDAADMFALPSRTEGLPRAMIEAMARGLPCIGSDVGGIPELISPACLVRPDDEIGLAQKIREVFADPGRMCRMSAENLARVADYSDEVLRLRREAFYRHLASETVKHTQSYRASRPLLRVEQ
ncbi:MAG TPA: glycosyltransferase family 4 protein [Bryobacteraceae bacterium]|jgi:glycosyltransferase involved in cell wall biosynthesis|nr:glycosyltransferase family 4 protein [Bryobacteraceae bacterium]